MRLTGEYEVITPLMIGGANHAPEFRLASYVHMLRWWWRFLALGRFCGIEQASRWEALLFGWHIEGFGRKRVSFRLTRLDEDGFPEPWDNGLELKEWSGINYLTAQGFSGGTFKRNPVKVRGFKVEARINKRALQGDMDNAEKNWCLAKKTLVDAMALIGLLGGLGARSRRGFGSLAVSKLTVDGEDIVGGLPDSSKNYKDMISTHLGADRHIGLPPYSALSDHFGCEICAAHNDARELMSDIGWAFQIYRSWGHRIRGTPGYFHAYTRKVNGQPKPKTKQIPAGACKGSWYQKKFTADHNEFYQEPLNYFDNRSVFGLPHNYGPKIKVGWDFNGGNNYGRRASPLLFHFHRLADGRFVFVSTVVSAQFAPSGSKLHIKKAGKDGPGQNFDSLDFDLLDGFARFLRDPDATGCGKGVQHTVFTIENIGVAP